MPMTSSPVVFAAYHAISTCSSPGQHARRLPMPPTQQHGKAVACLFKCKTKHHPRAFISSNCYTARTRIPRRLFKCASSAGGDNADRYTPDEAKWALMNMHHRAHSISDIMGDASIHDTSVEGIKQLISQQPEREKYLWAKYGEYKHLYKELLNDIKSKLPDYIATDVESVDDISWLERCRDDDDDVHDDDDELGLITISPVFHLIYRAAQQLALEKQLTHEAADELIQEAERKRTRWLLEANEHNDRFLTLVTAAYPEYGAAELASDYAVYHAREKASRADDDDADESTDYDEHGMPSARGRVVSCDEVMLTFKARTDDGDTDAS